MHARSPVRPVTMVIATSTVMHFIYRNLCFERSVRQRVNNRFSIRLSRWGRIPGPLMTIMSVSRTQMYNFQYVSTG